MSSVASPVKKITFECRQCKFKISRAEKDLSADCPKCCVKNPYVSPTAAAKKAEVRALTSSSSKASRVSTKQCPKAPEVDGKHGTHQYEFGTCKFCKKAEGVIEDKAPATGAALYPGQQAECNGGKHMFKFSKCTKCGKSELEYLKEKKAGKA